VAHELIFVKIWPWNEFEFETLAVEA
jgi:hypothetical protein